MLFNERRWKTTAHLSSSPHKMDMDVKRVIEELETGGQDTVLMALQSYNKEVKLCAVNVLLLKQI